MSLMSDKIDKLLKALEEPKAQVDEGNSPSIEDMLKEIKESDRKRNEEIRELLKPRIEKMLKTKSKKRNCGTCQHSLDLLLTQYNNTPLGDWTCRFCDDGSGKHVDWTPITVRNARI